MDNNHIIVLKYIIKHLIYIIRNQIVGGNYIFRPNFYLHSILL